MYNQTQYGYGTLIETLKSSQPTRVIHQTRQKKIIRLKKSKRMFFIWYLFLVSQVKISTTINVSKKLARISVQLRIQVQFSKTLIIRYACVCKINKYIYTSLMIRFFLRFLIGLQMCYVKNSKQNIMTWNCFGMTARMGIMKRMLFLCSVYSYSLQLYTT